MKDSFQKVRCFKGYARLDVSNKQARARLKAEIRKELKKGD